MAIFHSSLILLTIYTIFAGKTIGTIQSSSRYLLHDTFADVLETDLPEILPDRQPAADFTDNFEEFFEFFDMVVAAVEAELPQDVLDFYDTDDGIQFFRDILIFTQSFTAFVDAECVVNEIDFDELVEDIVELLTDAARNDACMDIELFTFGGDLLRRRRRLLSSSDSDDDEVIFADLSEIYAALFTALEDVVEESGLVEFGLFLILGETSAEIIEEECDLTEVEFEDLLEENQENFEDYLALTNGEGGGEGDADDSSDESDDDTPAPTVGMDGARLNDERARDDVDLEKFVKDQGLESVDGDGVNGTEVITLRVAESTMVNIWIVLAVFCCFNVSMVWWFMLRGGKKPMVYVSEDERGGSFADGQRE